MTNQQAKSVAMYLGTQEGLGLSVSAADPSVRRSWIGFFNLTYGAWQDIGLVEGVSLHAFSLVGGVHNTLSWERVFGRGLALIYQADFPVSSTGSASAYITEYAGPPSSVAASADASAASAGSTSSSSYSWDIFGATVASNVGIAIMAVGSLIVYSAWRATPVARTLPSSNGDTMLIAERAGSAHRC